jgi:hypothetical protein
MDISRKFLRCVFSALLFPSAFLLASSSLAEIYKCQQPDGLITLTDKICVDGNAEPIVLLENSPLDNTAERENIARYQRQQISRSQRKPAKQTPQVLVIDDTYTQERNAKITAQEHSKKKRKGKTKKRRKSSAAKSKQTAAKSKPAAEKSQ